MMLLIASWAKSNVYAAKAAGLMKGDAGHWQLPSH